MQDLLEILEYEFAFKVYYYTNCYYYTSYRYTSSFSCKTFITQIEKKLLDPKSNVLLFVAQAILEKHKSDTVKESDHPITLESLDGLILKLDIKIPFLFKSVNSDCFSRVFKKQIFFRN